MKNNKIAITTSSFAENDLTPVTLLKNKNLELRINNLGRKIENREIVELCGGCVGIVAGTELYDRHILTQLQGLKAISRCGVGLENIDLAAADELGIKIMNTPDGPTLAVAELTVGLIFDLLRNISKSDREIRKGIWRKRMGYLLEGKKVGIIGFGRIGRKVALLLSGLGCEIFYFDTNPNVTSALYKSKSFSELLAESDIITLHCSAQMYGKKVIGRDELKLMKNGAFLINVSREELLDEDAVYEALISGRLAGLAIDTFKDEPYTGKLIDLENVVLTPHIGSYAKESRIAMEIQAVNNLLECLKEEI